MHNNHSNLTRELVTSSELLIERAKSLHKQVHMKRTVRSEVVSVAMEATRMAVNLIDKEDMTMPEASRIAKRFAEVFNQLSNLN